MTVKMDISEKFTATYTCRRLGKSFEALAGQGYGFETEAEALTAVEIAEAEQDRHISAADHLNFSSAMNGKIGDTWYRPVFWGDPEIATITYIGNGYLLSAEGKSIFISSGEGDYEYVFTASDDAVAESAVWAKRFETPTKFPTTCHYCGMPAREIGFFGELVCGQCE